MAKRLVACIALTISLALVRIGMPAARPYLFLAIYIRAGEEFLSPLARVNQSSVYGLLLSAYTQAFAGR